jgi:hypothetical protein
VVFEDKKNSNQKQRRIFINKDYPSLYYDAVVAYNDNINSVKDTETLLKILYPPIRKVLESNIKNKFISNRYFSKEKYTFPTETSELNPTDNIHGDVQTEMPLIEKQSTKKFSRKKPATPKSSIQEEASNGISKLFGNLPITTKKVSPMKAVPEECLLLMEHWSSLGFKIPNPEKAPKTYNKTIRSIKKIMDGRLIPGETRKFNPEDIKVSMNKFATLVFDIDYGPKQPTKDCLEKKSLADFFYNSHARGIKSWFIECHEKDPQIRKDIEMVENNHPEITNRLKRFFCDYVLSGFKKNFTEKEENKFRETANKIDELYRKKGYRFTGITKGNYEIADLLCAALSSFYGEKRSSLTPGHFASSFAFSRLLAYMGENGYIVDTESNRWRSFH